MASMTVRIAKYHKAVRSYIPSVSSVPYGGQIAQIVSQHCTTWWSDSTFYQSALYHMVVRSYILSVNTVPHGGHIVHSVSQHCTNGGQIIHSVKHHCTTWWSDRTFCHSTLYHMVVRPYILSVNTVPHGV